MVGRGILVFLFLVTSAYADQPALFPVHDIGTHIDPDTLRIKRVYFVTGDLGGHLDRIDAQFTDSGADQLRQNLWQFLSFQGESFYSCPGDDAHLKENALSILGNYEQIVREDNQQGKRVDKLDKYGMHLLVAASYLGRCHFRDTHVRLQQLYRDIAKSVRGISEGQVILYPSTIGFYCEGDFNRPPNSRYLFALRNGILWGFHREGLAMPSEFEISPEEITREMRPGGLSEKGFMGSEENYKDVIALDKDMLANYRLNDAVVTPRSLGENLMELLSTFHRSIQKPSSARQSPETYQAEVPFRNMKYSITCDTSAARWQLSPYKDGLQGICDYKIKNLTTDGSMEIAGIVPYLITVREFFEGRHTPYRVDPITLLNLFESREDVRQANRKLATNR